MTQSIEQKILNSFKAKSATEFSVNFSPEGEDGPTYLFVGSPSEIVANITQFMALRKFILEEGLAKVIGEPLEKHIVKYAAPCGIQIHWRLTQGRPWEPQSLAEKLKLNRKTLPRPQCYIQNVDTATLTWQRIKDAAGGEDGYMWGRFYAHAKMVEREGDMTSSWNLTVYGNTEENAIKRLKALASLSKSKIGTLTGGEQKPDEGRRKEDTLFRKPSVRIYPAWFFVVNYALVEKAVLAKGKDGKPIDYGKPQGRATSLGKKLKQMDAFYLNAKNPSQDDLKRFKEVLREPRPNTQD